MAGPHNTPEQRAKVIARNWKHGANQRGKRLPEYGVWADARTRCTNPRRDEWPNYGGRGITMCERWLESFADFLADMGPRPSPKHTIERVDNDGPYAPENCCWATRIEQARNTRVTPRVTIDGITKTRREWAALHQIPYTAVAARLRYGWTEHEAVTIPRRKQVTPRRKQS